MEKWITASSTQKVPLSSLLVATDEPKAVWTETNPACQAVAAPSNEQAGPWCLFVRVAT